MWAPSFTARPTGMLCTRPPSKKCSLPTRTGGSRPGTAAEASTAGTIGPLVNQCAAARSMLAATHWNGTARSSMRATGRSSRSSRRSGSLEWRWVPERASVVTRPNSEPPNASLAAPSRHTWASRDTAAAGSAATKTPLNAPTEVPRTRSAWIPASASACSMPTSCAPRTPPPPSTNATPCRRPGSSTPSPSVSRDDPTVAAAAHAGAARPPRRRVRRRVGSSAATSTHPPVDGPESWGYGDRARTVAGHEGGTPCRA